MREHIRGEYLDLSHPFGVSRHHELQGQGVDADPLILFHGDGELQALLEPFGGSAGFFREEQPPGFSLQDGYDAWIFSFDNEVVGDPP